MLRRTSRTVLALAAGLLLALLGVAAPASAATLAPNAPTGLAATTELGYRVERCDPLACAATTRSVALPANTSTWSDTTVVDGREYHYVVVAVGGSGHDAVSGRITHTAGRGLAAPTGVSVRRVASGLTVTWRNQVSRPVQVWRCDTRICIDGLTGTYRLEGPWDSRTTTRAGATSFTDRFTPLPLTTYSYRVQVVTPDAVSAPVYVSLTTP